MANGYIQSAGENDYSFGSGDFTVEFFSELTSNANVQTFFEICDNPLTSNSMTRMLLTSDNGYANLNILSVYGNVNIAANVSTFTSPITIDSNVRISYNGNILLPNQYSVVSNTSVTLSNVSISNAASVVEISQISSAIQGGQITSNTSHFFSVERKDSNLYLFMDGVIQNSPNVANAAIPSSSIAILTIGANHFGLNPIKGKFGDFRITKGTAVHVVPKNILIDPNQNSYGNAPSDIIVSGGQFSDSLTNNAPEELVNSPSFDALTIVNYHLNTNSSPYNNNNVAITYTMFKPFMDAGAVKIMNYTTPNVISSNVSFKIPWSSLNAGDASVTINGIPISSDQWSILNGNIRIYTPNVAASSFIEIYASGPERFFVTGANNTTTLASPLNANDANIHVTSVAHFPQVTPNPNSAVITGEILINGEHIRYRFVDSANNVLYGLTRGLSGTGVANVYPTGTYVINMAESYDVSNLVVDDSTKQYWYTLNTNTSLQNTSTIFSNILVQNGGIVQP